jgi:hypothetical protein
MVAPRCGGAPGRERSTSRRSRAQEEGMTRRARPPSADCCSEGFYFTRINGAAAIVSLDVSGVGQGSKHQACDDLRADPKIQATLDGTVDLRLFQDRTEGHGKQPPPPPPPPFRLWKFTAPAGNMEAEADRTPVITSPEISWIGIESTSTFILHREPINLQGDLI